jgi:hypothetical protein
MQETEMKKLIKIYLHGSKESMRYEGEKLGLSEEALEKFMYCCYEVALDVLTDMETGESEIVGVDGKSVMNIPVSYYWMEARNNDI